LRMLAREGMTGPDKPFEGRLGIFEKVTGEFDARKYLDTGSHFRIEDTLIKPAGRGSRVAHIAAMCEMRDEIGDPTLIKPFISIHTI